jgi:hypothetical protein
MVSLSPPESAAVPPMCYVFGGRAEGLRPPGSKSVANWQTQIFFGRNHHGRVPLQRQLSLPTVANSVGKLANSMAALVGAAHNDAQRSLNLFQQSLIGGRTDTGQGNWGIGLHVGLHGTWQPLDFLGNLLCTLVCIARGSTHAMHAKQCFSLRLCHDRAMWFAHPLPSRQHSFTGPPAIALTRTAKSHRACSTAPPGACRCVWWPEIPGCRRPRHVPLP